MTTLTIGQVAAAAGVNIQTIRYYERRGLLATPRRTASGYRQYTGDAVNRIRFIKHAQELGFSLKEIQELLALRVRHAAACNPVLFNWICEKCAIRNALTFFLGFGFLLWKVLYE